MEPVISQPPATPVIPPVPSVPPTSKKSNSLVWVLFFLVFLLSVVVAFFVYQNLQLQQQLVAQLASTPVSSPIPTADPTADWKVYISDDLGIQFKYPANLVISVNNFQSSTFWSVIDTKEKLVGMGSGAVSPIEFSFDLNGDELEKAISQAKNSYTAESLKIDLLNLESGVDITVLSGIGAEGMLGGERTKRAYFANRKDKTIVVNYYGYVLRREDEINELLFDQILSTFKFTN